MVIVTVAMLLIRPWFQEKGGGAGTKSATKSKEEKFVVQNFISAFERRQVFFLLNVTSVLPFSFPGF